MERPKTMIITPIENDTDPTPLHRLSTTGIAASLRQALTKLRDGGPPLLVLHCRHRDYIYRAARRIGARITTRKVPEGWQVFKAQP